MLFRSLLASQPGPGSSRTLHPILRQTIEHQLQAANKGLIPRCAAEALGAWPDPANLQPLLNAVARADGSDTHYVYVLRKALRDHLAVDAIFSQVSDTSLSDTDLGGIVDVLPGLTNAYSGRFIARNLTRIPIVLRGRRGPSMADLLQQAGRYAPVDDVDRVVAYVRASMVSDARFQQRFYLAIQQGLVQRGAPMTEAIREWGRFIAQGLTATAVPTDAWINHPLDTARTPNNPWDWQDRRCADGSIARLLSTTVVIGTPPRTEVSMSRPDIPNAPSPIMFRQNLSGCASFAPIISGIPNPRCVVFPHPT